MMNARLARMSGSELLPDYQSCCHAKICMNGWIQLYRQMNTPPHTHTPVSLDYHTNLYTLLKRSLFFPSPAGMSLTKLTLAGNNLIIFGRESLVSDTPAGNGKNDNIFYSVCMHYRYVKYR
jgi:hypothetical protein